MSEPSLREQLRQRLEAGMARNAGPSEVGPGGARVVRFSPRVEELNGPPKAEDAGGAAESEELLAEKRRVFREALGGEEAPGSGAGSMTMSSSEFATMRRAAASPVATPGQGSRVPPMSGQSAIGSSGKAPMGAGGDRPAPKPSDGGSAMRMQMASPKQAAAIAAWRASVVEKKAFSGPGAVASAEDAKRMKE